MPRLTSVAKAVAVRKVEQADAIAVHDQVDDLAAFGHLIRRHPQREETGILVRQCSRVLVAITDEFVGGADDDGRVHQGCGNVGLGLDVLDQFHAGLQDTRRAILATPPSQVLGSNA